MLTVENSVRKDIAHVDIERGSDIFPSHVRQELLNPERHHHNIKIFIEINTLPTLDRISRKFGRQITLGCIPVEELDNLLPKGRYDAVWMMGIWERSPKSTELALNNLDQYRREALPNADNHDIAGSAFAISGYQPDKHIAPGGWAEIDNFRARLHHRGMNLFVDLITNHLGIGCEWSINHPNWFVRGDENLANQHPEDFYKQRGSDGNIYWFARGKEYRDKRPWTDTLQLNYANPQMRQALINQWINVAKHTDGGRFDMAGLVTNDQFIKNWGDLLKPAEISYLKHATEFLAEAIYALKRVPNLFTHKQFVTIAETYTYQDLLKQCGFDHLYAKIELYNLIERIVGPASETPQNLYLFLDKLSPNERKNFVRMNENHDEPRTAGKFGLDQSLSIAVINTFIANGYYMMLDGQTDGCQIKLPVQLSRMPIEEPNMKVRRSYDHLFTVKNANVFQNGDWSMAERMAVGWGNQTFEAVIPQQFNLSGLGGAIVCTNIQGYEAESNIKLPEGVKHVFVHDLTNNRDFRTNEIAQPNHLGMYVKLPAFQSQIVYYSYT